MFSHTLLSISAFFWTHSKISLTDIHQKSAKHSMSPLWNKCDSFKSYIHSLSFWGGKFQGEGWNAGVWAEQKMGTNSPKHLGNQHRRHLPGGLEYLWLYSSSDHAEFAKFLHLQQPRIPRKTGGIIAGEAGAGITAQILLMTLLPHLQQASQREETFPSKQHFPQLSLIAPALWIGGFIFTAGWLKPCLKSQPQIAQSSKSERMKSMQKRLFLFCYYLGCSHIPGHTFPLAALGKQLLAATCGPGVVCFCS